MFPEEYTQFIKKTNAKYDGDPKGDYVLAEHINTLQDAIGGIERAVGIHSNSSKNLQDRIIALETLSPLRAPGFHWYEGPLPLDTSLAKDKLRRWDGVFLSTRTGNLSAILKDLPLDSYGVISGQLPLSSIQTEIGSWKKAGVTGILITDFELVLTRTIEQSILNSIKQEKIATMIRTKNPTRILNKDKIAGYNSTGAELKFDKGTTVLLENFAYNGRSYTTNELMATTLPLVLSLRSKNLGIIGLGNAPTETTYQYLQTAALLFGLDGIYNGPENGSIWGEESPVYSWNAPLVQWKTNQPGIYQEEGRISRTVPGGLIGLEDPSKIILRGPRLHSALVDWVNNTVPGSALKESSIDPSKLSTYDIAKIVELLNTSGSDIQIDLSKIKMNDGQLPANIAAENMIVNVIEAINRKANPLSTEKNSIEDAAIKSLDASKLTGDIERQRFEKFVIPAIIASEKPDNFLKLQQLESVNISSPGTISGNVLTGDNLSIRQANVTESISTVDLTTSGYHTGNSGEYTRLVVDWLTAYKLDGLKELHVETFTADNIGALVLEAIDANIENGTFNNIVTESLKAGTIQAELVTALNAVVGSQIVNSGLFGEAVIGDAQIKNLSAGKINSGVINTALVNLSSPEGHLNLTDRTLSVYDSIDEEGFRRKRVLLGHLKEITKNEDDYGLVVLGADGSTRLYDHTGVYNAGIHQNAISEEKLQDDSISERVIRAGSIVTTHLQADVITSEKIASDAILANHILAGEIVGDHISGATITGANIAGGTITGGNIKAGSINATHIQAYSIGADKIKIGFTANLIRDGYDSFEQEKVGTFPGIVLAGTTSGEITRDWSWDGRNAFAIMGNAVSNRVQLSKSDIDFTIPVFPGRTYIVSAWVKTESTNQVPITLGLAYNKLNAKSYSSLLTVSKTDRIKRVYYSFKVPAEVLRASIILGVESTNTKVFFDCLQIEEAEVFVGEDDVEELQTVPGFWKSTAVTRINGDNIETGYVKAEHIHIGGGTVFGANNDIIDITDEGIKAKSPTGHAMLNSKGLEIVGGAFSLVGGIGLNKITMNGTQGLRVENSLNQINVDAATGFSIINKAREQIVMDVDPTTGDLRISGLARFYSANNPEMAWSIDEKIGEIEDSVKDIQGQVDGSITSWFKSGEPSLANYPAKDWATNKDKDTHLGDLYYNEDSGIAYRFSKSEAGLYSWVMVRDTDVILALEQAQNAQDTADGKRRAFYVQPIPPYDKGDLWVQGSAGELMRSVVDKAKGAAFATSDWVKATKYTDDTAVDNLEIGGRNYILETNREVIEDNSNGSITLFEIANNKDLLNKEVTFSFELKSTHEANGFYSSISRSTPDTIYTIIRESKSEKDFKKYEVVFKFPNSEDSVNIMIVSRTANFPGNIGTTTYKNIKLEKGNKATDWTPAPEDVDATIIDAKDAASKAQSSADVAIGLLIEIGSDNKATPPEKKALYTEWSSIQKERATILMQASTYNIPDEKYRQSYDLLSSTISPLFADMSTTSDINGETLRVNFTKYYEERQLILEAVVLAVKNKNDELEDAINEGPYADKVRGLSGTEIYTDKSDDAVVYIEVDGKSVQNIGNGNISKLTDIVMHSGVMTVHGDMAEVRRTSTTTHMDVSPRIDKQVKSILNKSKIYVLFIEIVENTFSNGDASFGFSYSPFVASPSSINFRPKEIGVKSTELSLKTNYSEVSDYAYFILTNPPTGSIVGQKIRFRYSIYEKGSEPNPYIYKKFIAPAPFPDYPIEIESLNNFDVASSVGRENLILNSGSFVNINNWRSYTGILEYNLFDKKIIVKTESTGSPRFRNDTLIPLSKKTEEYTITVEYAGEGDLNISGKTSNSKIEANESGAQSIGSVQLIEESRMEKGIKKRVFRWNTLEETESRQASWVMLGMATSSTFEIINFKIEKGSESTSWVPSLEDIPYDTKSPTIYKTNILLSEPLRSVGDVKDKLFRDSDGLWKVERNVGETILKGNEPWSMYTDKPTFNVVGFYMLEDHLHHHIANSSHLKVLKEDAFPGTVIVDDEIMSITTKHIKLSIKKSRISTLDVVSFNKWLASEYSKGTPLIIHATLPKPTIETLPQTDQDKFNNIASFKGDNYVYTVFDKSDILSPTLHATFKSQTWYENFKRGSDLTRFVENGSQNRSVRLAMSLNQSDYNTAKTGWLYFCKMQASTEDFRDELVDEDGSIYDFNTQKEMIVPKQGLNLTGVIAGTSGYIVFDSKTSKISFIFYKREYTKWTNPATDIVEEIPSREYWLRWNPDAAGHNTAVALDESIYIIGEIEI